MAEKGKLPENYKHIVRIANVDVPGEKQIRIALTNVKGVGINYADVLCAVTKIKKTQKTGTLSNEEIKVLNEAISDPEKFGVPTWFFNRRKDYETGKDKHFLTGTLNFVVENDLKRLKKIKTLRGMRHQKGLPVRGQRTRSNFRKSKGKVVGVKKKAAPAKK
ncbi:MAG: 30S ribosomal protein S13 [Nanoarchaeota archaeon]|nr:30S ribosomal protein S13 [Nanoarchaeota archaeon]MBU1644133.1 30S ribosomal protein S13 [Nanoarchaeota archaeon]MBU1976797.1 30S ribosomal protein S13 [Nanoarchaeota archaeon]